MQKSNKTLYQETMKMGSFAVVTAISQELNSINL